MAGLVMMKGQNRDEFPAIRWDELEDDHSDDRVGYSVLTDDRNQWAVDGKMFVLDRI